MLTRRHAVAEAAGAVTGDDRTGNRLAVECVGLTKVFGSTRAVDGVDLAIAKGDVFGFLGPNGAGKTTTIKILATLIRPDGGHASVFGHDVVRDADAVRRRLSLTSQFASVDQELTTFENLVLIARLLGYPRRSAKQRAAELLDAFDLADAANRQIRFLSGGMRRRLDIAASLVVRCDLMFLDEPTTGLDPRSRRQVWDIIRSVAVDGTTVLLTTQYLDEADALAGRIAVIDSGAVIAEGTSAQLKASVGEGTVRFRLVQPRERGDTETLLARELGLVASPDPDPAIVSLRVGSVAWPDVGELGTRVLGALSRSSIAISDFSLGQPSLDEVFLALTGHTTDTD